MYQHFIFSYLYEAQHVSSDTPPIIRSLKLHWQPLVFHMWKAVRHVVGGRCQAVPDNVHQLHVQQSSTYNTYSHCCILLDFLYKLFYDAWIHEHQAVIY